MIVASYAFAWLPASGVRGQVDYKSGVSRTAYPALWNMASLMPTITPTTLALATLEIILTRS